jgi:streptogramin lyase
MPGTPPGVERRSRHRTAGLAGSPRGNEDNPFHPPFAQQPAGRDFGNLKNRDVKGRLRFTEQDAGKIGRVTPAGAITEYPVPTSNSGPLNIAAGQGRTLWFTEFQGGKVGRITGI